MTGLVERGVDAAGLRRVWVLTAVLVGLYLLRILFRFLSNYLAHRPPGTWWAICGRRPFVPGHGSARLPDGAHRAELDGHAGGNPA